MTRKGKEAKGLNYGFMSNVNHDKKRPKYNIPCLSFYYIANLTCFNGSWTLTKNATSKLHAKLGSEKAFHVWVKYNHYKRALIAKNVIDIART